VRLRPRGLPRGGHPSRHGAGRRLDRARREPGRRHPARDDLRLRCRGWRGQRGRTGRQRGAPDGRERPRPAPRRAGPHLERALQKLRALGPSSLPAALGPGRGRPNPRCGEGSRPVRRDGPLKPRLGGG
jgi:hypothetical protein